MTNSSMMTIQVALVLLSLFAEIFGLTINSRACMGVYDGGLHTHVDELLSFDKAKTQCDSNFGKLPMPTQLSWMSTLRYIALEDQKTKHKGDGTWIGVVVTKTEDSKVTFIDSDKLKLNESEIKNLSLNASLAYQRLKVGERFCVTYHPQNTSSKGKFLFQHCKNGRAKVACICRTGIQKRESPSTTEAKKPETGETGGVTDAFTANRTKNYSTIKGRAAGPGNEGNNIDIDGPGGSDDNSPTTSVATILGVVLGVCVIASVYFLAKSRGHVIRDGITRRMPYNRPRQSENGSSYRQGRITSEESSGNHRPIHVYEEILMRNAAAGHDIHSNMVTNSTFSTNTLPHLPPPEPPINQPEFVQIHDIRNNKFKDPGYLQPSFRRPDTIPGDVRSPPPANITVFNFPETSTGRSSENLLQVPEQKELKYASVETVQTLVNGEIENDEEYLVDDDGNEADNEMSITGTDTPTFILTPNKFGTEQEKSSQGLPQCNRNSVPNPYVDIMDVTTSDITMTPAWNGEYENERFLRTVMKVAPKKPRRTARQHIDAVNKPAPKSPTETQQETAASSNSKEPVYSKVKRKNDKAKADDHDNNTEAVHEVVENAAGYTPMRKQQNEVEQHSTATSVGAEAVDFAGVQDLEKQTSLQPSLPSSSHEYDQVPNNHPISASVGVEVAEYAAVQDLEAVRSLQPPLFSSREYDQVPVSLNNPFISTPVMLSTTNSALSESSLVCYEIPPEEYNGK